jgi:hypothetical protein
MMSKIRRLADTTSHSSIDPRVCKIQKKADAERVSWLPSKLFSRSRSRVLYEIQLQRQIAGVVPGIMAHSHAGQDMPHLCAGLIASGLVFFL